MNSQKEYWLLAKPFVVDVKQDVYPINPPSISISSGNMNPVYGAWSKRDIESDTIVADSQHSSFLI